MPAASPAAPPVQSRAPVQVTAPKRVAESAPLTHEYWYGTLADSPRQNYSIGGVVFPLFDGAVDLGENGELPSGTRMGKRAHLSDAQIEAIKKDVLNFVVRWQTVANEGQPWQSSRRGDVLDVRGADPKFAPHDKDGKAVLTYRAPLAHEPQDEPFGRYIYLYPVVPGMTDPEHPEPMISRAEPVAA